MTGPARGYSWPSFTEGNAEAETHGAHSERRWRPLAEALRDELLRESPWLTRPSFALALGALCAVEAKLRLVDDHLDRVGLLDEDGNPRAANALADRLSARAITLRGQCGLDPMSFAKLLSTFSGVPGGEDALAALRVEGARLVAARTAALPVGGDDDTGPGVNGRETHTQPPETER